MHKTIKQTLMCDLTDKERREYGIQLATTLGDMEDVEAEKKRHMDHYKDRLGGMQATADTLGRKVRDGKEWREVDCRVMFGAPDKAHKQTVRLDTHEVVKTELMTELDLQRTLPLEDDDAEKPADDGLAGSGWDKELLEDTLVDLLEALPGERAEFLANAFADGTGGAFLDYVLGSARACDAVKHEAKRAMLEVAPDYPHEWISDEAMTELLKITKEKSEKKQLAALQKAGQSLPRQLLCEMDLLVFSKAGPDLPVALKIREVLEAGVADQLAFDDPAKNLMPQNDQPEGENY
jgi:hypothetical protein